MTTTYSSKSTALRGAKRAGLQDGAFTVEQTTDGRWVVSMIDQLPIDQAAAIELPTADEQDAEIHSDLANEDSPAGSDAGSDAEYVYDPIAENAEYVDENEASVEGVAADADDATEAPIKEKAKTYKEIANYNKSAIEKPVQFIHAWLTDQLNMKLDGYLPALPSRKEAVTYFVSLGINYSTARTQYQRWFSARKKGE